MSHELRYASPEPSDCDLDHDAEHDAAPGPFRLDRRSAERHPIDLRVTALRRDHDPSAYRHPACGLKLCNLSESGLAAIADAPLEMNSRVSVCFPAHGGESGIELVGHIVRCTPRHGAASGEADERMTGYEVAICFDPAAAA